MQPAKTRLPGHHPRWQRDAPWAAEASELDATQQAQGADLAGTGVAVGPWCRQAICNRRPKFIVKLHLNCCMEQQNDDGFGLYQFLWCTIPLFTYIIYIYIFVYLYIYIFAYTNYLFIDNNPSQKPRILVLTFQPPITTIKVQETHVVTCRLRNLPEQYTNGHGTKRTKGLCCEFLVEVWQNFQCICIWFIYLYILAVK